MKTRRTDLAMLALVFTSPLAAAEPSIPVNVTNFIRAETDLYFSRYVRRDGFGKFVHDREMTPIDKQDVVRMNRDTVYSTAIFDLDAGPVTITLPDPGGRFMSMQVISQDHYTADVVYAPGRFTYTKANVGTRYVATIVRTLANPENLDDLHAAHAMQDAIKVDQAARGVFTIPNWDRSSQTKIREAVLPLGTMKGTTTLAVFGSKKEVDPVLHFIGTATGWGGNPRSAAVYQGKSLKTNDGQAVHRVTVKNVPVDGFWSVSVYNSKGYFEKNELNAYSLNNLTATPNDDGSFTIQFGGCDGGVPNCLPTPAGWNYTARLYRPRKEILDGTWKFPDAKVVE